MGKWFFLIILLLTPLNSWAQETFIKDGNVYFRDKQNKVIQLTTSGKDSEPYLSPDGKSIAFVRDTPGLLVSTGTGDENATELWLVNIDSKQGVLLVKGKNDPEIEKALAGFNNLRFSPDGHSIYFMSAAWVVSDAVQKITLDTKEVQFMIDGVSLEVVQKGKYRGFLLVERFLIKFDKKGNSLGRDFYLWLVSPDGKPIKEIGQTESKAAVNFKKRYLPTAKQGCGR